MEKMRIYKVEQGNIYEGVYQSFYYLKLDDAKNKAEEMRKEKLDYAIDHMKRMGKHASPYVEAYKIQNENYWTAGQEYLEIMEIEVQ